MALGLVLTLEGKAPVYRKVRDDDGNERCQIAGPIGEVKEFLRLVNSIIGYLCTDGKEYKFPSGKVSCLLSAYLCCPCIAPYPRSPVYPLMPVIKMRKTLQYWPVRCGSNNRGCRKGSIGGVVVEIALDVDDRGTFISTTAHQVAQGSEQVGELPGGCSQRCILAKEVGPFLRDLLLELALGLFLR